jgi:glyoxylate carboligase
MPVEVSEEYKKFLSGLTRYWFEPSTFQKAPEFIEQIKKSNLTSLEIGMLRDNVNASGATSDTWQRIHVFKGMLEDTYQERKRAEIRASKPWITRMMEQHSTAIVLFYILSVVVSVTLGYYLRQIFEPTK